MKRILAIVQTGMLILTFCACGAGAPAAAPTPTPTSESASTPTTSAPPEPAPQALPGFTFSTVDREGAAYDESIFAGQKLIMINFWEPWCPPCVGEMPDLEKLYEDYKDEGFLILGVYSTEGMESDVDRVLEDADTHYPILHYVDAFDRFQTGYVPTTVFIDGGGHVLTEPAAGSDSYEGWESIVLRLMGE